MKVSRPLATGMTIATFFIVGITGVLLFFHIDFGGIEHVHEWVGIAMIIACMLHIIVNFTSFKKFFYGKSLMIILASFALSVVAVLMMSENPKQELFERFKSAKLNHTIEYLETNKEKFAVFLAQKGITTTKDTTLNDLLHYHQIDTLELLHALLAKD